MSTSNQSSLNQPEGMDGMRSILSLDDAVSSSAVWSPDSSASLTAIQTWDINTSSSPNFSPLTSFFQALGLPSISYDVPDGVWTEADYSQFSTGFITNEQGELVLSLLLLDS